MANSADPDQLASDLDLHCLQRQGISGVLPMYTLEDVSSVTNFITAYEESQ